MARLARRNRLKCFYSNLLIILCLILVIGGLVMNQKSPRNDWKWDAKEKNPSMIHRIQAIPILDEKYQFKLKYQIRVEGIPEWIARYQISHLFNFYWFQTGGYKWHLQQMMDLKHISPNRSIYSAYDRIEMIDDLHHHPEHGVIIDTAPDPFQPLFPPLPQTSSPLNENCGHLCSQRKSPSIFQPLFTYGLYNMMIGNSSSKKIHYDEIIYLFDDPFEKLNGTFFITQILPRLIRLLALVPRSAVVLSPYLNPRKKYVNQYLDLLIQREILVDRKRLIQYHPSRYYHAYVVYSTSSPRSDLILLHHILTGNQSPIHRSLILIIRNKLDQDNYDQIVQIIDQFDLPVDFHIHQYNGRSSTIKQIGELFRQAIIVIGMSSHTLSHIVWCAPGTQIIEIGERTMRSDYYDISLQLKLDYWWTMGAPANRINSIDFRNLMLKVFTHLNR